MKSNQPFSLKKRLDSFKYAFSGLKTLIKEEHNSRIHFLTVLFVCIPGFFFGISRYEWIAILLAIALVISMEALNSGIENISDFCTSKNHPLIKKAKDVSAFAVLFSALIAAIIGFLIFQPYFLVFFIH
jgi:diacylglycerol kinase